MSIKKLTSNFTITTNYSVSGMFGSHRYPDYRQSSARNRCFGECPKPISVRLYQIYIMCCRLRTLML